MYINKINNTINDKRFLVWNTKETKINKNHFIDVEKIDNKWKNINRNIVANKNINTIINYIKFK